MNRTGLVGQSPFWAIAGSVTSEITNAIAAWRSVFDLMIPLLEPITG
jgi:hypothetical protein